MAGAEGGGLQNQAVHPTVVSEDKSLEFKELSTLIFDIQRFFCEFQTWIFEFQT